MRPLVLNGEVWAVRFVEPSSPRLVERGGTLTIGVTDPVSREILVSSALVPPLLDAVLLHEAAHAIAESYGLTEQLQTMPRSNLVAAEEWSARLVEGYSIEALSALRTALGRPVCVRGYCYD